MFHGLCTSTSRQANHRAETFWRIRKYKFPLGKSEKCGETMAETAVRFYIADASCQPSPLRGRKESSIDMEPRTLNQGELHSARKAAVEIMREKEPEEARTIFTKGLRPVRSVKEMQSLLQSQTPLIEKQPQGFHLQCSKSLQRAPCCECQYLRGRRRKNKIEGPSSAPF